jgi:hypothetical protein
MKFVRIYDVVKDETILVELLDDQLTLDALEQNIRDRGKYVPLLAQLRSGLPDTGARLILNNSELKRQKLPASISNNPPQCVHMLPHDVEPTAHFTLLVKVLSIVL